ncbi:MAG TPA: radical SAM protein [Candidatus Omnitrophota bacterium]|nr:radical SAM protein [Candidatus Omnitrophota bacterium]
MTQKIDPMDIDKKITLISEVLPNFHSAMRRCDLCVRACKVDRTRGHKGFCRALDKARVYTYQAHHGEEPPISGTNGSGTIFFSGCSMACVYCQNWQFSQKDKGEDVSDGELAGIMLKLQDMGCHNINLVTPTHFIVNILEALRDAYKKGLKIPVVYNTGGYDSKTHIEKLDRIVDIYLPDMRYSCDDNAVQYSKAPRYVENNRSLIKEMYRQVGILNTDENGVAKEGLIVRMLVLPGNIAGIIKNLEFIAALDKNIPLSVMSQYRPVYKAKEDKVLSHGIKQDEYRLVLDKMKDLGLEAGWIQPMDEDFDPRFLGENFDKKIFTE